MAVNKTSYVVDSSVFISYLLPDEVLPESINLLIRKFIHHKIDFIAPVILKYEIGNALKSAVKQKRLNVVDAKEIYQIFLDFQIHFLTPDYHKTLQVSFEHNLSFYDSSYLCLAKEKNVKLLTSDKKLLSCKP